MIAFKNRIKTAFIFNDFNLENALKIFIFCWFEITTICFYIPVLYKNVRIILTMFQKFINLLLRYCLFFIQILEPKNVLTTIELQKPPP